MRARTILSVAAIAAGAVVAAPAASRSAAPPALTRGELRWLGRVTFGIDTAAVARYRALGREKFLDEQLHPPSTDPAALAAAIGAIPVTQQTAQARLAANRAEQQRIATLSNEDQKQSARNALNQAGNQTIYETTKRQLMRALESPSQLREQMTWFWMNHFSVFSGKGNVRWTVAEYEEQAVRAHALGRFSDLVMATATSPAMLEYLDNAQSAAGKINENYARELMELHTLGVSGGASGSRYTQADVQELARVLTGVGLTFTDTPPKLPVNQQALYLRRGLFEFNPARHDFGTKTVLGHTIAGKGLAEVEDAVRVLCREPATARFISARLATYFVADQPPPALIERMARAFQQTDGTGKAPFDDRQMALLSGMYAGTRFQPLISEGFDLRKTVADQAEMMANGGMAGEMQAANRNALTAKGFELEARRMAGLMKEKFNIGFIDIGGWDTHVNQGNAQGQLANLLTSLGQGLAGFADSMGPGWNRTVVFVLSEFGRTFRENGTRGTDHGHGSAHWILGGAVHGGRIVGEQIAITPGTLNQQRDFPVLTEYRTMLGGIFKRMYSLDQTRIARVFPNTVPLELGLL